MNAQGGAGSSAQRGSPGEHSAGPPQPFFQSRWVPRPEHVRELAPDAGLPAGFRAAGVACGIKASGRTDLGLLVCDAPDPVSAARFTASALPAAPVQVTRERCRLGGLRAVLANSGSANAATGEPGRLHAAETQQAAASMLGLQDAEVALASTGAISHELPVPAILQGLPEAHAQLRPDGDADFQLAIQTTDLFEKRARLDVTLAGGAVVGLSAECKGAGMISPRFATMLCFIETDAGLNPDSADLLLGVCVKRSFERVSVDGQLSTNDTAILICSGASGVRIAAESEDELRFGEALDALMRQLAILLVADGEGARRIARVLVRGGDPAAVEAVARAVGNSPLVKTALHGGDPNWGRILQAVGASLAGSHSYGSPLSVDLSIEGILVCEAGAGTSYDAGALHAAVQKSEVEYEIDLPGEGAEAELFFSDLSHEYVTINADYTNLMRDVGTLLEALPYIREFHGKTVVIKYGGAAMEDPDLREEFARDVVLLKYVGLDPIVVHGGGPEITAYMERLGLPVSFVDGLRVSDAQTVEIVKMVLVGKVNKEIVMRLNRHGQSAVGLCGDDGSLFRVARRASAEGHDIGFVGRIERVNVDVLLHVASDYIPVIASVGGDREGNSYNVNADEAAGAVARAIGAYKVIFLTDVPGWLEDPGRPESLIAEARANAVRDGLDAVAGGMRPKLAACIDGGVSSAHIVDGRVPHSVLLELFTNAGIGTKIIP